MVHTLPDYTTKYKMTTVFGSIDVYEAAARLKSPVIWDRRGNVRFLEDFSGAVISWYTQATGTGGEVTLDAAHYLSAGQSVKLKTGTGENNIANIQRGFPYPIEEKVGFEMSFTIHGGSKQTMIYVSTNSGTTVRRFGINYNKLDEKLEYFASNATWKTLDTDVKTYEQEWLFHRMKIVVDLQTNKYIRGIFDNKLYNMEAYSIYTGSSSSSPHMLVQIQNRNGSSLASTIYVDNFIYTVNEP